jgi:hypothetical protein
MNKITTNIVNSWRFIPPLALGIGFSLVIKHIPNIAYQINQANATIVFATRNSLSVPINNIESYLNLIDGEISYLKTDKYLIRRRLDATNKQGTHALFLDVYNREGKLLGTRVHNQTVEY